MRHDASQRGPTPTAPLSGTPRRIAVLLLALLIMGCLVRCWVIAQRFFPVHDEAISMLQASGQALEYAALQQNPAWIEAARYREMLSARPARLSDVIHGLTRADIHPPLYWLALEGWLALIDQRSLAALCLLNILFYLAGGAALFALARRSGLDPWSAALAVALWSFSPVSLDVGCQARQYALLSLLIILLAYAVLLWRDSGRPAVLLLIALLSFLAGIANYPLQLLVLLFPLALLSVAPLRSSIKTLGAACCGSLGAWLLFPIPAAGVAHLGQAPADWIVTLSRTIVSIVVLTRSHTFSSIYPPPEQSVPIAALLVLALTVCGCRLLKRREARPVALLFFALFGIQIAAWLIGAYPSSAMDNRYISYCIPFAALVAAGNIDQIVSARAKLAWGAGLSLALLASSWISAIRMTDNQNGNLRHDQEVFSVCDHLILNTSARGFVLPLSSFVPDAALIYASDAELLAAAAPDIPSGTQRLCYLHFPAYAARSATPEDAIVKGLIEQGQSFAAGFTPFTGTLSELNSGARCYGFDFSTTRDNR